MPIDWSKIEYSENEGYWLLRLTEEEVRILWNESFSQQKLSQVLDALHLSSSIFGKVLPIAVVGTPETYDADYEPTIEKAVQRLPDLLREAEDYLKAFLDLSKIKGSGGKLFVQWLEFGTWKDAQEEDETKSQVEVSFTLDKDVYGWWIVRFGYVERLNKFWPLYFSREQT